MPLRRATQLQYAATTSATAARLPQRPLRADNTVVQALTLVDGSGAAVPLSDVKVAPDSDPHAPASVTFAATLKAESVYSLVLSSLTRRDVGDTDPTAASLALVRSAARNTSGLSRAHAEFWAGYWDVGAAVSLGSRSLLKGWWYAPAAFGLTLGFAAIDGCLCGWAGMVVSTSSARRRRWARCRPGSVRQTHSLRSGLGCRTLSDDRARVVRGAVGDRHF